MSKFYFVLIVLIAGCSNRSGIPGGIIPIDSMSKVMKDMIMADEYFTEYVEKDSTQKDKVLATQNLYEKVFQLHHITREEFKKSISFYESRPDLNKKIFDSLAAYANKHKPDLFRAMPAAKPPKALEK